MARLQATLKLFNSKLESSKNTKMVAQRCFLYFLEMFHLSTFLIAECGELASLRDFLSRQVYYLQNDVEMKDQMLETLNCNVQTVNKSRDFIYNRCTVLENKVNELGVELLSASQERASLEANLKHLREELKMSSASNSRLESEKVRLQVAIEDNRAKAELANTMASVLVHVDGLLHDI